MTIRLGVCREYIVDDGPKIMCVIVTMPRSRPAFLEEQCWGSLCFTDVDKSSRNSCLDWKLARIALSSHVALGNLCRETHGGPASGSSQQYGNCTQLLFSLCVAYVCSQYSAWSPTAWHAGVNLAVAGIEVVASNCTMEKRGLELRQPILPGCVEREPLHNWKGHRNGTV